MFFKVASAVMVHILFKSLDHWHRHSAPAATLSPQSPFESKSVLTLNHLLSLLCRVLIRFENTPGQDSFIIKILYLIGLLALSSFIYIDFLRTSVSFIPPLLQITGIFLFLSWYSWHFHICICTLVCIIICNSSPLLLLPLLDSLPPL